MIGQSETSAEEESSGRPRVWRYAVAAIALLSAGAFVAHIFLDGHMKALAEARMTKREGWVWAEMFVELGKGWVPIWLLLVFVWATGKRRALIVGVLAAVLAASVVLVKVAVSRPRPDYALRGYPGKGSYYQLSSFPSGDTALAFSLATGLSVFVPGAWRAILFLAAAMVGLLRVAAIKHYPSDVFAGAAFGVLCGWCAIALGRKLASRAPPWKLGRARWLFALVAGLPVLEPMTGGSEFRDFLPGFGPFLVGALVATKGEVWLRWLRGTRLGRGVGQASAKETWRKRIGEFLVGVRGVREKDSREKRAWAAVAVLIVLVGLAVIPGLGWTTLYDPDEGYYAEAAREMLVRGDPFVPHVAGQPWLEKPPLTYWLMAASMRVLGEGEVGARLPCALAGLMAMALVFHLGRRMFSPEAGVLAAAALGTCVLFAVTMRWVLLDNVLLCCLLLAMIGMWKVVRGEGRGAYLFWVGCGLGFLAKGLLGFVLPAAAAAGYLLWTRRWGVLRQMKVGVGIPIALAVAGIWALPAAWMTHGEYFREMLWMRTLRPVFVPLQGHGGRNVLEYAALLPAYIPILFLGFFPWSTLAVPALRRLGAEERRGDRVGLLGGWFFAQLAIFSLVRTKLPHHALPMVPPAAIAVGVLLADVTGGKLKLRAWWGRWGRVVLVAGWVVFAVVVVAAPVALGFRAEWPWFLPAAVAGLAGAAWTVSTSRRRTRAIAGMLMTSVLGFGFVWQFGLPRLEGGKAPRELAGFLREHFGKDGYKELRLGVMNFREYSLLFYAKKTGRKVAGAAELQEFLREPGAAAVVMPEKTLRQVLEEGIDARYETIWRKRAWLPEKGKWEEIVVVSNEH